MAPGLNGCQSGNTSKNNSTSSSRHSTRQLIAVAVSYTFPILFVLVRFITACNIRGCHGCGNSRAFRSL